MLPLRIILVLGCHSMMTIRLTRHIYLARSQIKVFYDLNRGAKSPAKPAEQKRKGRNAVYIMYTGINFASERRRQRRRRREFSAAFDLHEFHRVFTIKFQPDPSRHPRGHGRLS